LTHLDLANFNVEDFDAALNWLCTLSVSLNFTEELLEVVIDGNELFKAVEGTPSVPISDDLAESGNCLC